MCKHHFPYRRGYATERQKGLLIVAKLDYLQSRLLQRIFFVISKPLGKVGKWISEVIAFFLDYFTVVYYHVFYELIVDE